MNNMLQKIVVGVFLASGLIIIITGGLYAINKLLNKQLPQVENNEPILPTGTLNPTPVESTPTVSANPEVENKDVISWEVIDCNGKNNLNVESKYIQLESKKGERKNIDLVLSDYSEEIDCYDGIRLSDKYLVILTDDRRPGFQSDDVGIIQIYSVATGDMVYEKIVDNFFKFLLFLKDDNLYYYTAVCDDWCYIENIYKIDIAKSKVVELDFGAGSKKRDEGLFYPLYYADGEYIYSLDQNDNCQTITDEANRESCLLKYNLLILDLVQERIEKIAIQPDIYAYCPIYLGLCNIYSPKYEVDLKRNIMRIESYDERCAYYKPEELRDEDRTACKTEAEKMKRNRTVIVSLETGEEIKQ